MVYVRRKFSVICICLICCQCWAAPTEELVLHIVIDNDMNTGDVVINGFPAEPSIKLTSAGSEHRLQRSISGEKLLTIGPSVGTGAVGIYVEPGEITAYIDLRAFPEESTAKVVGSKAHRLYEQYLRMERRFTPDKGVLYRHPMDQASLASEFLSIAREHAESAVSRDMLSRMFARSNAVHIPIDRLEEIVSFLSENFRDWNGLERVKRVLEHSRVRQPGQKILNFNGQTLDGKLISLYDHLNASAKLTLVDFWSTGCIPCREQFPHLRKVEKRYRSLGLQIVAVSVDPDDAKWRQVVQRDGIETFEHIRNARGLETPFARVYGITGIPANFLLDEQGMILANNLFGSALDEKVEQYLR